MSKRIILSILIIGFLAVGAFTFAPAKAKAISLADIENMASQINSLTQEIASLKSLLGAQAYSPISTDSVILDTSITDTGTFTDPGSIFPAPAEQIATEDINVSILEKYNGWSFNQFYNLSSSIIGGIQSTLITLGYDPGMKDYKWGLNTYNAYLEWMKDQAAPASTAITPVAVESVIAPIAVAEITASVEVVAEPVIALAPSVEAGIDISAALAVDGYVIATYIDPFDGTFDKATVKVTNGTIDPKDLPADVVEFTIPYYYVPGVTADWQPVPAASQEFTVVPVPEVEAPVVVDVGVDAAITIVASRALNAIIVAHVAYNTAYGTYRTAYNAIIADTSGNVTAYNNANTIIIAALDVLNNAYSTAYITIAGAVTGITAVTAAPAVTTVIAVPGVITDIVTATAVVSPALTQVTVTSPGAGVILMAGDTMNIEWMGGRLNKPMRLSLIDPLRWMVIETIEKNTLNDRFHRWIIPSNIRPGNYLVYAHSAFDEYVPGDTSSLLWGYGKEFTIIGPTSSAF